MPTIDNLEKVDGMLARIPLFNVPKAVPALTDARQVLRLTIDQLREEQDDVEVLTNTNAALNQLLDKIVLQRDRWAAKNELLREEHIQTAKAKQAAINLLMYLRDAWGTYPSGNQYRRLNPQEREAITNVITMLEGRTDK